MCITHEQYRRLTGRACARCGPDGAGRLAWPVVVCRHRADTGGAW